MIPLALDLNDLFLFSQVVQRQGFSAAARSLGLPKSRLSRRVSLLEERLGARLLQRNARNLRLTDAGQATLARCRSMLDAADEAVQQAQQQYARPQGRVRISMPKAFGRFVVAPLLPAFLARYPQVDVELFISDRDVDPLADGLDLTVRVTDTPPPGMAGRPLLPVRQLLCASPHYLAMHGRPAHPRDLAQHQCLYLAEHEADKRWQLQRGKEQLTVAVTGRYATNHSELRLEGVLAHLGIAPLPHFTAQAALDAGQIETVLDDWEFTTAYRGMAWLLYPPNRYLPPKVRVLIDYLADALADHTTPMTR
ncbi:LysR family transcriptional regulator [Aquitalea magnusonii]|uniref:LysR family transcriptional regulator n=1 Tax=Aquitalea magnusonii TaxID=332411 RepID=UPI0007501F0E|nr:LysR family transcriptional regulator [Aquitalea magnusonii]